MGMQIRSKTPLHVLRMSPELLGPIESQERFLLQIALLKMPCPACKALCHQVEASQRVYDLGGTNDDFACPACKEPLTVIVPFLSSAPWLWSLARRQQDEPTP